MSRSVIISSSGLKNIFLGDQSSNNEFHMMFDEIDIKINKLFAEFISPIISRICNSDPTTEIIQFKDFYADKAEIFKEFVKETITEDIISLIHQISSGYSIDMNDEQAYKMRFISILLGNEELFTKINEFFPPEINEANLETYISYFTICYQFSQLSPYFDFSTLVEQVATNFSLIEPEKLLTLPMPFQYAIISNPRLRIESEDSLYDYIVELFENKQTHDDEFYDDILFYEQIEFSALSPEKLNDFLSKLEIGEITNGLWSKLLPTLTHQKVNSKEKRYANMISGKKINFEYKKGCQNRFNGIIHYLNEQCHGNSASKGIINVSTSKSKSYDGWGYSENPTSNVVDYDNKNSYISVASISSNWVKLDFKEKSVRPTNYSIRTWNMGPGNSHLMNWSIEGSNDDTDWRVLDSRVNEKSLDDSSSENTFDISTKLASDEAFRYLRLRVTGPNSRNTNLLFVSAIEFFGKLCSQN